MKFSNSRVTAHLQGDCDQPTCDLCALDQLDELANICDGCKHADEPTETCEHGKALCGDCADEGECQDCALDQAAEDAADAAISWAREECS